MSLIHNFTGSMGISKHTFILRYTFYDIIIFKYYFKYKSLFPSHNLMAHPSQAPPWPHQVGPPRQIHESKVRQYYAKNPMVTPY